MSSRGPAPVFRIYETVGSSVDSRLRSQLGQIGRSWGWLFTAGLCFVVLGIAAYAWPVTSTVSLTVALGVLFVAGGLIRIAQAIQLRRELGSGWRVFDALLSLVAGVLLLRYPGSGMVAIAIAMVFFFLMSGIAKSVMAYATRPHPGSGWMFVSAIASLALGVYMIATFPISALWVPGVLLGIEFIIYGVSLIGISLKLRKLHHEMDHAAQEPTEMKRTA